LNTNQARQMLRNVGLNENIIVMLKRPNKTGNSACFIVPRAMKKINYKKFHIIIIAEVEDICSVLQ
jgi:hypothetical protein